MTLRSTPTCDVEQLAVLAGVPDPARGVVRAEVTARGPLETLTAEARVSGTDLSFRDLEGVQLVAETSYDRAAQQARLARLEVAGARRQRRRSGRHRAEYGCGHESARC